MALTLVGAWRWHSTKIGSYSWTPFLTVTFCWICFIFIAATRVCIFGVYVCILNRFLLRCVILYSCLHFVVDVVCFAQCERRIGSSGSRAHWLRGLSVVFSRWVLRSHCFTLYHFGHSGVLFGGLGSSGTLKKKKWNLIQQLLYFTILKPILIYHIIQKLIVTFSFSIHG